MTNVIFSEVSNLEYYRPKGCPPKRFKSSVGKYNNQNFTQTAKKSDVMFCKEHNIQRCIKHKSDLTTNKMLKV